jgi:hypothetical protein
MLKVTMYIEDVNWLVIEAGWSTRTRRALAGLPLHAREAIPCKAIEADLSSITYADQAQTCCPMHHRGARLTGTGAMT